jgi:hypothetical protein
MVRALLLGSSGSPLAYMDLKLWQRPAAEPPAYQDAADDDMAQFAELAVAAMPTPTVSADYYPGYHLGRHTAGERTITQ